MAHSIHVSQEDFFNGLWQLEIENDKSRGDADSVSEREISQTRALLIKAQWKTPTAPHFATRINLATS